MNPLNLRWYEFRSEDFPARADLQPVKEGGQEKASWFATRSFVDLFYDTHDINAVCFMVLQGYSPIRFFTGIPTIVDSQNQPLSWYTVNCVEFRRTERSAGLIEIHVTVKANRRVKKPAKKQNAFRKSFEQFAPFSNIEFENVKYLYKFY